MITRYPQVCGVHFGGDAEWEASVRGLRFPRRHVPDN